jgi:hypothetical protein
MYREIKESDWKLFRRLHPVALERFCKKVLEEINQATSNCSEDYHQGYLEVFRLIMDRNEQMARAFDDTRRSTAIFLLTNNQGKRFTDGRGVFSVSPETRARVESILEIRRP